MLTYGLQIGRVPDASVRSAPYDVIPGTGGSGPYGVHHSVLEHERVEIFGGWMDIGLHIGNFVMVKYR